MKKIYISCLIILCISLLVIGGVQYFVIPEYKANYLWNNWIYAGEWAKTAFFHTAGILVTTCFLQKGGVCVPRMFKFAGVISWICVCLYFVMYVCLMPNESEIRYLFPFIFECFLWFTYRPQLFMLTGIICGAGFVTDKETGLC